MTDYLKSFVNAFKEAFERSNLKQIYDAAHQYLMSRETGELTEALLSVVSMKSILQQLKEVPPAFLAATDIEKVDLPEEVTQIGHQAFWMCKKLSDIQFSNNITYIGNHAFNSASSLTHIELPDKLAGIGLAAFYNCDHLNSVVLPASLKTIDTSAFRKCTSLLVVHYKGTRAMWERVFHKDSGLNGKTIVFSDGTREVIL